MAKLLTMYNNKGGVSKTTTLFNLAAFLSRKNKKVLIVDCDPQCNVTELFLASHPEFDNPNIDLPGTSIFQSLKPRFEGMTAKVNVEEIELINSRIYNNLYLLRGDIQFSRADNYFSNSWNNAVTDDMHEKNTYVSLHRLFHGLGNLYEFDYILCDVGPSTSHTVRLVFLACDGYFIPAIPDRFNNQAIQVLSYLIPEWIERDQLIARTFPPFGIEIHRSKPRLMGLIFQSFHPRGKDLSANEQINDMWESSIKKSFKNFFHRNIPSLDNLRTKNPVIADIPNLGILPLISQTFGIAIFDIRRSHLERISDSERSNIDKNYKELILNYQRQIESMERQIGYLEQSKECREVEYY